MMELVITQKEIIIIAITALWTLPWKAVALWKAARLSHKWWFVAMLFLNTLAILEIIYIFWIARGYQVESKEE